MTKYQRTYNVLDITNLNINNNLMKYSIIFLLFLLSSCTEHDYYTIASPKGDKCLTIDDVTMFLKPGSRRERGYVKIYYGSPVTSKNEFIKLAWDNVSGFDVDWGANPIKITDGYLLENTMPNNKINYQPKMTMIDDSLFHAKNSLWRSYDYELITKGEYEKCK